jgi:hypothetical protein
LEYAGELRRPRSLGFVKQLHGLYFGQGEMA